MILYILKYIKNIKIKINKILYRVQSEYRVQYHIIIVCRTPRSVTTWVHTNDSCELESRQIEVDSWNRIVLVTVQHFCWQ
jgi:hypothetical protein